MEHVYGVSFSKGGLWWSSSNGEVALRHPKYSRSENKLDRKLEEKERMKIVMVKQPKEVKNRLEKVAMDGVAARVC
ncbi:hypothetical protein TSUD_265560 [Trifolium subterraneum]|uniref:Uncharacterized protein n=1 Tax=Trifolium subterraneum TaxID=3900 RepID=A0A2Z6NTC8_TRISU|nr:hypothetical protein TSUD_265560 [Trifolium subterraneum]